MKPKIFTIFGISIVSGLFTLFTFPVANFLTSNQYVQFGIVFGFFWFCIYLGNLIMLESASQDNEIQNRHGVEQ